jgi:hypothetical protein
MKRLFPGLLLTVVLLIFAGCPDPNSQSITISGVGWYIDNIDPSYWTSSPPTAHAFFRFDIAYSGSSISAGDVNSIRVTAPDAVYWEPPLSSCTFDTQNKRIYLPALFESSNIDSLPIGIFTFLVTLANGTTATRTLLVPAPNSTTTGTYTRVYTEDIAPPATSTPLVTRATLGAHSNAAGTLTINFTVTDSKVYNGYVWLYDAANTYIGYTTTRFRDSANGNVLTKLNGGGAYNTNGTNNIITLTNSDITYQSGKSFADINKFIVVLTDGLQYTPGSYSGADCRSISAKTAF